MAHDHHAHGSHEAWEEVYKDLDLTYSENANTQGKLFEMVKIDFLSKVLPKSPAKILEVGCGTAFVSLYFAKRDYIVTCLDINQFILDKASENFKKEGVSGNFVQGDAEKLPFKTGTFDAVTSFGLLEHFEHPELAIKEMIRILKPGGLFFADIVPNRFSVQSFGNIFNALVVLPYWTLKGKPYTGWQKAISNFRPHYFENSISWQDYQDIMLKAGAKKIEVRGNRPFARLTLPKSLDHVYAFLLKPFVPLWKSFDKWDNSIPRIWGAGLWFWGKKN